MQFAWRGLSFNMWQRNELLLIQVESAAFSLGAMQIIYCFPCDILCPLSSPDRHPNSPARGIAMTWVYEAKRV